ncbi:twin-arginine translocation signal domain-containing protein [Yoonia litorea]|uniref:Tat (Twin-arginine translocation) pathway signal sequence n=1 Tax=Yoonia litorea TaxID=1123755 RepID=A0A1I6MW88_9RHOB|nr:twin-arginine translocation signal domain-containing protein [Yoonia litorea]SFS19970.1 Tat (twin-arginine translocation) pathway signal sequence [Yoonia litorea]
MAPKTEEKRSGNRRDFLKLSVTAAPAAAVALAGSADTAEAAPADLSSDTLQDTAQTRAYYDSARF